MVVLGEGEVSYGRGTPVCHDTDSEFLKMTCWVRGIQMVTYSVHASWFMVWGLGVWDWGFGDCGFEHMVPGFGVAVQGSGFGVWGFGDRGVEHMVSGFGVAVKGSWFGVWVIEGSGFGDQVIEGSGFGVWEIHAGARGSLGSGVFGFGELDPVHEQVSRVLPPDHRLPTEEGRYKATWKREFTLPWREAGAHPPRTTIGP